MEASEKKSLSFKCQTLKEEQYAEKKRTTAGGLFIVSACGLFVGVRELYGSESLTQVHLFLLELFVKHELAAPTPSSWALPVATKVAARAAAKATRYGCPMSS